MWYFTWLLGLGFALLCGLVNLLWLEARWAADEDLKVLVSHLAHEKGRHRVSAFYLRHVAILVTCTLFYVVGGFDIFTAITTAMSTVSTVV